MPEWVAQKVTKCREVSAATPLRRSADGFPPDVNFGDYASDLLTVFASRKGRLIPASEKNAASKGRHKLHLRNLRSRSAPVVCSMLTSLRPTKAMESLRRMKTLRKLLTLAVTFAGLNPFLQAVPQLRVFDGATTITLTDGGGGDVQAAPGQVVFVGSIGNWVLNVHVGTTYPVVGSLANPSLDLSFNATSTGSGGTLQILFAADGFGPSAGRTAAAIGGAIAAGGSVTYTTYGGTNNTNFSTVNLLTSQGPFGPGAFSGTVTGASVNNAGPYALTQIVTITHQPGTSQTTGNAALTVPDNSSSAFLLGSGLLGLGWIVRLRRRAG